MPTCYFCGAPSTSREHVPPKCLFPKKEGNGAIDYRRNLSTVPSCDDHNYAKTHDDEYLKNILVMPVTSNAIASTLFLKTTMKAAEKYPKLLKSITFENQPVIVQKSEEEQSFKSVAVAIDRKRVSQALSMIGYALYFLEYEKRYSGSVKAFPLFLGDLGEGQELNAAINKIRQVCDDTFEQVPKKGTSHDIFFYQTYFETNNSGIMYLSFYSGTKVCCLFESHGGTQDK